MPNVLIVDDTPDAAELVARLLRKVGHEAVTAEDGAEALGLLLAPDGTTGGAGRPFDLVLLDVMMPGLDGFDVLRAVRSDRRTAGVPVVMYSAAGDAAARRRAAELGADGYLVKGQASFEDLWATVDRHAGDRRAAA